MKFKIRLAENSNNELSEKLMAQMTLESGMTFSSFFNKEQIPNVINELKEAIEFLKTIKQKV